MRKITFTTMLVCLSFALYPQQSAPKGAVGVTFSGLGDNSAFYWQSLDGIGSQDGKGFYSLGITYIRIITSRIDLETGIEFSRFKYEFKNMSTGSGAPKPYEVSNNLIGIPLTVRLNFSRYFFINGGLLIDFDTGEDSKMESQSGVGAMLGMGVKYDLKNVPVGFFVNPYYKHHRILNISMDKYPLRSDDLGFRFGMVYRL